ncbi:hypothetical protein BURKHO8Y_150121 [Burkholderia sp. 8Y]|nr:hypothetical protein BURKHO8Y_150121 [Burkholderia sp. 8Y]
MFSAAVAVVSMLRLAGEWQRRDGVTRAALIALNFGLKPNRVPLIALSVAAVVSAAAVLSMRGLAGSRSIASRRLARRRCPPHLAADLSPISPFPPSSQTISQSN